MKVWIAAALLIAPDRAWTKPAAPDSFCADLARIVAAARARPPFGALPRHGTDEARPMFGFRGPCGVTDDRDGSRIFVCSDPLRPAELSWYSLAGRIAACLPEAAPGRALHGGYPEARAMDFRLGRVLIGLSEGGHYTAAGGRLSLRVSIVRLGARGGR